MEIEKKFLVKHMPSNLEQYQHVQIEQGYISTSPVIRIRQSDRTYYLTCKSHGMMAREEFELEITMEEYLALKAKVEGKIIQKKRYYIPINKDLTVELDIFEGVHTGIIIAEVEFPTIEEADAFHPLDWFGEEVTMDHRYHNSYLSK